MISQRFIKIFRNSKLYVKIFELKLIKIFNSFSHIFFYLCNFKGREQKISISKSTTVFIFTTSYIRQ